MRLSGVGRASACAALLIACGGGGVQQAPAAPASPTATATGERAAAPPRSSATIEYVVVHRKWVEKTMQPGAADFAAWYETPDGRAAAPPLARKIVFEKKAAALAALTRLKKGEPFDAVSQGSIDPAGELPHATAALEKLAVDDAALVEEGRLFVVVKKERPSERAIERAYRVAKAPETLDKLGHEIIKRLDPAADARSAISEAVTVTLGEHANADPDRPHPVRVDEERLRTARMPSRAKQALEALARADRRGERTPAPVGDGETVVVARTVARSAPPR